MIKLPRLENVVVFVISLIVSALFLLGRWFFLCFNTPNCYVSMPILNLIIILFCISIWLPFYIFYNIFFKTDPKTLFKQFRFRELFLITAALIMLGGLGYELTNYVKITDQYLETADPFHTGTLKIDLKQLSAYGVYSIHFTLQRGCSYLPYILINNKQEVLLYPATDDLFLLNYLKTVKKIPETSTIDRCRYP